MGRSVIFPVKRQIYFQLFELVDDYIQQEIRKPPEEKECNVSLLAMAYSTTNNCLLWCFYRLVHHLNFQQLIILHLFYLTFYCLMKEASHLVTIKCSR